MESRNIMIVGVGGQGTLLASKLLGRILLENGYDDKGEADIIISFELLEAARWVEYLKEDGILLTNTQRINPMPVITGAAEYPKSLEQTPAPPPIRLDAMDALGLALQAGSAKAVNLVLLGRLSKYFHFTDAQWQDAICRSVPAKFLELNRKAFALGAEA